MGSVSINIAIANDEMFKGKELLKPMKQDLFQL